jgi:DNA ligase (NAD+)
LTTEIQQAMTDLQLQIEHHNQLYYIDAAPEISDLEYDKLLAQLRNLEKQHPEYARSDSPTQQVGEQTVVTLQSVPHRIPMLSIDNTYNLEELNKFGQRTLDLLDHQDAHWVVELKIDGVAASVIYENGKLVRAVTRGDGKVGDDITHNIRTIADLPAELSGDHVPAILEVRGEVYMTNQNLARINEHQQEQGGTLFKNTRNATAGSIRQLDSTVCAQRHLQMFCHGIGYCEGITATNHMEFLDEIRSYGLPASPLVESFPDFATAVEHCQQLTQQLQDIDFEVDGIVLKLNDIEQRSQLGSTTRSPRWIVAYKWERYEAITCLNEIRVQIGKTGAITPVAELEPVELAGTTVSRASLHNADEIQRKDIRVGDVVVVEKAGKIIPRIVRVETHERTSQLPVFEFPTACPECETTLVRDVGGVYIRCPNYDCPAQLRERLCYFAGRTAMDIEGLGDRLVEQLVEVELVKTYADLYRITTDQIAALDRMGMKSAKNVVEQIELSKQRGLDRLLNALSIRHVGATVATLLAKEFGNIQSLSEATVAKLSNVEEIGDIIAEGVFEYMHTQPGIDIVSELAEVGVLLVYDQAENSPASDLLADKTFVVTGTLTSFTRGQIHELIIENGGKTSTSVSSKTSFLIAGENAGSKLTKAEKLGITVLSESDFENMLK